MYLVDTNIWLERLLDQDRSAEVGQFLAQTPTDRLLMSDFTLHSIGVVLARLDRRSVLLQFVDDVFVEGRGQFTISSTSIAGGQLTPREGVVGQRCRTSFCLPPWMLGNAKQQCHRP